MRTIAPILCAALLSACSATTARSEITYPNSLFTCLTKPDATAIATDNDLAIFITRQDAVIDDCKGRLQSLRDLLTANQARSDK